MSEKGICPLCERPMSTAFGCSVKSVVLAGKRYDRLTYGQETYEIANPANPPRCHDCGAQIGGLHHDGCDWEQCPRCKGQFLSCGCYWIRREAEQGG